tara:strand:+ start:3190 stop:3978 length:789 start_codon:yes stop_codon:yes gene_type:complete
MKKLTALMIALGFAGVTQAATITGTVELDITQNANNDYISTESIKLGIGGDSGVAFGSINVKTNASNQVVLDEYSIGANINDKASVSYGEQGDIFIGGGLETVGANTIANPSDAGESIVLNISGLSLRGKFSDTDTDISDFDTVQAKYSTTVNKFTVGASVDHTITTDDNIYAGSIAFALNESANLSTVLTHDASLTNEVAYESIISVGGLSAYVDGDDSDWSKNVGAGYKGTWKDLGYYVEGNYNLDSKDATQAMGVSIAF